MSAFAAIADPVRRSILTMLRDGPMTAGQIAAEFAISRPAVSRHLRVLRDAAVVEVARTEGDGRERSYGLRLEGLDEVGSWLAGLRGPARIADLLASPALDTEVRRARRDSTRAAARHDTRGRGTA